MKNITSRSSKIGHLISAPLQAVVNANASMQRQQAKLLMEICFKKTGTDTFTPITIDLVLTRSFVEQGANGEPGLTTADIVFSVPLITLVPFSALSVKKADFNFSLEVVNQIRTEDANGDETTALTGHIGENQAKKPGKDKRSDKSKKSLITVDIKAESVDLPLGLKAILGLYEKTIRPVSMDQETN